MELFIIFVVVTVKLCHSYHITKFIMKKLRTSFALLPDAIRLLKLLADKNRRSAASMIEELIFDAAKKEKIK